MYKTCSPKRLSLSKHETRLKATIDSISGHMLVVDLYVTREIHESWVITVKHLDEEQIPKTTKLIHWNLCPVFVAML